MMTRHGTFGLTLLVGLAALAPLAANASLVDVQFGSPGPTASTQFSGAAMTGAAGDQWNYLLSSAGNTTLTDSAGLASGISMNFFSAGTYGVVPNQSGFYGTPYAALMQSFLYTTGTITITLGGLNAGEAFSLYIYGQSDGASANYGGTVTVNGATQTALQTTASSFVDYQNYLLFQGTADSSGNISISDAVAQGRSQTMVNGIQLLAQPTSVPEPATLPLPLLGAGLAALTLLRRRTRTHRPA